MARAASVTLPVLLLLAACPGSTADPCAGVSCAEGRTCVNGECQTGSTCTSNTDCNYGEVCSGGQCVAGSLDLSLFPDLWPQADGSSVDRGTPDAARTEAGPIDAGPPDTVPWPDSQTWPDTQPWPDMSIGSWYQANAKECTSFCAGLGLSNVGSVEGAKCISGEVRPASAVAQGINFTYGCWSSCAPQTGTIPSSSSGQYCYRPGQKQDDDGTDRTVGCFCK